MNPDTLTETANNAGIGQQATTPAIDFDVLGTPQANANIRPQTQPTRAESVINASAIPSAVADTTERDAVSDRLSQLTSAGIGKSAFTSQSEVDAGIPQFEKQVQDIGSEITKQKAILQQDLATITDQGVQEGSLAFATGGERSRRTLLASAVIQGLSAAQEAAQGNLTTAQNSVTRAVEAVYGPIEEELAIQKELLTQEEANMTQEEKTLAEGRQEALTQQQNDLDIKKVELSANMNSVSQAISDGRITPQQGAQINQQLVQGDTSGLSAIAAKSDLQLLQEEKLQGEIDAASAANTPVNIADIIGTADGAYAEISDQAIVGSSQFDKELDMSSITSINQIKLALSGVETLREFLAQGDDGLNLTGPVKGRVRNFIKTLGGDADAAAINAAIQGLIPTVARGIFGEVGVLTDTDIDNYKKTLPNMNSDEEQNDLVTIIMLDVLGNSFTNLLSSNAQGGRNTSRFYGDLLDTRARVADLKLGMGVTSFSGQSTEDFADSVPETETTLGSYDSTDIINFINN